MSKKAITIVSVVVVIIVIVIGIGISIAKPDVTKVSVYVPRVTPAQMLVGQAEGVANDKVEAYLVGGVVTSLVEGGVQCVFMNYSNVEDDTVTYGTVKSKEWV